MKKSNNSIITKAILATDIDGKSNESAKKACEKSATAARSAVEKASIRKEQQADASLSKVIKALDEAWLFSNSRVFNNTLPAVVFTIHKHEKATAHFEKKADWTTKDGAQLHEISITSATLKGATESDESLKAFIEAVILHNAIHAFNACVLGKKDTRSRTEHTKQFDKTATAFGFNLDSDENPLMSGTLYESWKKSAVWDSLKKSLIVWQELQPKKESAKKPKYICTCPGCGKHFTTTIALKGVVCECGKRMKVEAVEGESESKKEQAA